MEQLQQLEQFILEGESEQVASYLKDVATSTDLQLIYDSASLLVQYGFLEEADKLYETLLVHLPDEAQLKIDRASVLIEIGEEDRALLLLSEIKPSEEEYVQSLLVQADYYHMTGLPEVASGKVQEALRRMPGHAGIRFAYAELLLDSGKYAEAVRYYAELAKETEEVNGVLLADRLAEALSAGAAYEEAIPYYEESLQDARTPDRLFGAAFAYYQIEQYNRAIPLLEELISMDPDYFSAYMLLGQSLHTNGDEKKAYDVFVDGINRDAYDKELQLAAGKLALKLQNKERAEHHIKEALSLDPEYLEAAISLASLYDEHEQNEELVDLLSYIGDIGDEIPHLQAFLAYALERQEKYEDAYKQYKKAYVELKDEPDFLEKFANFLLEEGKRQEAIEVITRYTELVPDDLQWNSFLEAQNDEEV